MFPANYVPGVQRRQTTPIFDTVSGAAGNIGPTVVFFGHTAGVDGINVTNMTQQFRLAGTEKFTLRAIRLVSLGTLEADVLKMYKGFVLRFWRGRAVEVEAGPEFFNGGCGLSTPTAASVNVNNGIPDARAVASLDPNPIIIAGNDEFKVTLDGPAVVAMGAAYWYRVYLDGEWDKGVQ